MSRNDHGTHYWNEMEERNYLDYIGGWRLSNAQRLRMRAEGELPDKKRLRAYIEIHLQSSLPYHQDGVKYAKELLAK